MPWRHDQHYTMTIDLNVTRRHCLPAERNWRRNLKRSSECSLTVRQWLCPATEEIVEAYRSMESPKQLDEQRSGRRD
jgi:hypothetical protein